MPRPNTLKAICAASGITLRDLAQTVGCSPGSLYHVASGRIEPWPKLTERLIDELGFDPFTFQSASPEAVTRLVESATAQGLPAKVTDPSALAKVATVIGSPSHPIEAA